MPIWTTQVLGVFGSSMTQWGTTKLPFDLATFGMSGCKLHVSADVLRTVNAFAGTTGFEFPMHFDTRLLGLKFYAQFYVPDPTLRQNGASMSNAIELTIGRYW